MGALWGSQADILKKFEKKTDIRILKFITGYRTRKRNMYKENMILIKFRIRFGVEFWFEKF
jgi:hypothetical protein